MKVRMGANKDHKFYFNYEMEILKTSISGPTTGKAIIGSDIKNEIKDIEEDQIILLFQKFTAISYFIFFNSDNVKPLK